MKMSDISGDIHY